MHEAISRLILLLIVFLPLGSWGDSLLFSSIYVPLCMITGVLCLATQRKPLNYLPTALFFPPILLICLFLLVQLIPLSPEIIKLLSPTTSRAYLETAWIVRENAWMPLAVNSEATLKACLFVFAVGSLCLAAGLHITSLGHSARIMQFLNLAISVWALSAIVITTASPFLLNLFPLWAETIMIAGGRLNLWAICLMPILLAGHSIHKPRVTRLPLIEQFREFLRDPSENPHVGESLAIVLVAVSTVASRNWQGAILIICAWATFKALSVSKHKPRRFLLRGLFVFAAATCLTSLYLLRGRFLGSLHDLPPGLSSIGPYDTSWFHTWFGCGLGGHIDLLPVALPGAGKITAGASLGGAVDSWLGLGVLGIVLLAVLIFMLLIYALEDSGNREKGSTRKTLAGGATSLLLLILYGFYQPGLSWESLFLGICVVLLIILSPRLSQNAAGQFHNINSFYPSLSIFLSILVSAVLVFSVMFYAGLHVVKRISDHTPGLLYANLDEDQLKPLEESIHNARDWFPLLEKSDLPMIHGYIEYYRMHGARAEDLFERALLNRPLNPQIIMALTGTYGWLNKTVKAEQLISSGPLKNYRPDLFLERLITRLFNNGITETGLKVVQKTFELWPEYARKCLNLLYVNGWSHDEIQAFLPARTNIWIDFGDILYSQGKIKDAEEVYLKAVTMRDPEMPISREPYQRLTKYFIASEQLPKALIVAEAGVENFPKSGMMRRLIADVYQKVGNEEKAAQELSQADLLEEKPWE
jgi:tetratricopeptide (TPR) repeat protein